MREVLAQHEQELAPLERDAQALLTKDVANLNARAKTLGVEYVVR